MAQTRRDVLKASVAAITTASIAGCSALGGDESTGNKDALLSPDLAVAAEWNAMRARLWDALSLDNAGEAGAGAAIARETFERFEGASGAFGAHEMLEETDHETYEEFEEALGELRTEGLQVGDTGRAREEVTIASTQLANAQQTLVGDSATPLELQLLGSLVQDATFLAATGEFEAARYRGETVLEQFEESSVHDALEDADSDAYTSFESALQAVVSAADAGDAETVRSSAQEAFGAAIDGSYALAATDAVAGTGHIAALQARGWDAASLSEMGGPSTDVAHAAALTIYRARAADCQWLAAKGETTLAETMARDIFAHFESARVHEALEEADHEAYEGFEAGLSNLQSAIANESTTDIETAVEQVDSNLVTGIQKLGGATAPLLESAFFRARLADARERYVLGERSTAASLAEGLFQRFEENELDFHETVEEKSEDIYHRFEEEHLVGLVDAFENGNDSAVQTHYDGIQATLLEFETMAGSTATVSCVQAAFTAAQAFDSAVMDALGSDARAEVITQASFERFEAGAGGYHEALEEADNETYEAFEQRLGAIGTAADSGEQVYPVSKQFNAEALNSAYAIVEAAGGSHADVATTVMQDVFGHFESARVHELLEDTDRSAYHSFERQLDAYITALEDGGDVATAAASFARGCQYAQFALVDSIEESPLDLQLSETGSGHEEGHDEQGDGHGGDSNLEGGPNVVEGVPEDADHVVDMTAVAFEPKELTVSKGDTVAWPYEGGEPHTVTAYEDEIPEDADYWASGEFDSESGASEGWEQGQGAVQSGESYVHTFETTGTHEYYCIPHEAAGMVGKIIVE